MLLKILFHFDYMNGFLLELLWKVCSTWWKTTCICETQQNWFRKAM